MSKSRKITQTLTTLVVTSLFVLGCVPSSQLAKEHTLTDSIVIHEVIRDTVVTVSEDSSLIRALIECDSMGRARLSQLIEYRSGERISPPSIDITDNILTAKSKVDSVSIYLELRDRYKENFRNTQETVFIETNKVTGWQKIRMRFGETFMLLIIAATVLAIRKLF